MIKKTVYRINYTVRYGYNVRNIVLRRNNNVIIIKCYKRFRES